MQKRRLDILIVDDNPDDAELMAMQLEQANGFKVNFQLVQDEAGMRAALDRRIFDIVLFDYKMPLFKPERVLEILKELELDIPCILISGSVSNEVANQMIRKGARDYINKGVIAKIIPVIEREFELFSSRDEFIGALSIALEYKDWVTSGHSKRVTNLTVDLAREMEINETEILHIRRGALLHDIGKIGVADSVLLKRGALEPGERQEMQRHPQLGYDILKSVSFLRKALDIPHYHHEKWDGSGYPRGLKGEEIPLAARIFAVVDVHDALTTDRPYRNAISSAESLEYIREQSGKHFDPAVVDAFVEMMELA